MITCARPQLSVRSLSSGHCCVCESTVAPARTHFWVLDCGLLNSSIRLEFTLIVVVLCPWTSTLVLLHSTSLAQVCSSSFSVAVKFSTRLLFFFLIPSLGQIVCVSFLLRKKMCEWCVSEKGFALEVACFLRSGCVTVGRRRSGALLLCLHPLCARLLTCA